VLEVDQSLAGRRPCSRDPIFSLRKFSAIAPRLRDTAGDHPARDSATMKNATAIPDERGCRSGRMSFLPIFDVASVI